MNGSKLYAQLLNMRNEAGAQLFQRLRLAKQLLSDQQWVAEDEGGGGDEATALDRLEDECFADICGAMSLPNMMEILERIPTETTWKANKYNLRKMWTELLNRRKAAKGPKHAQPEREHKTREERKIEKLEAELQFANDRINELERDYRKLKSAFDKIVKIQEEVSQAA